MIDPVLGALDPSDDGRLVAKATSGARAISIYIDPDGRALAVCLAVARALVSDFAALEQKAKASAADELLETYNDGWRFSTALKPDGSYEDVDHPPLSAAAFGARLTLSSVSIDGEMATFYFDDGQLFGGHCVVVSVFDGVGFTDCSVDLFG